MGTILYTVSRISKDQSYLSLSMSKFTSPQDNEWEQLKIPPQVGNSGVGDAHLRLVNLFWSNVFKIFEDNVVSLTKSDLSSAFQYIEKSKQKGGSNTKENLLSKAYISDELLEDIRNKHKKVFDMLPDGLSSATYKEGTTGVVLIGGSRFSWLSYLSLLALRRSGSKLPVEVIMPTFKDYQKELDFCTKTLPALDASCVVVPDILGPSVMLNWQSKFANYQFKSLALVTCTFQNVLMLDSDNILIDNPDEIFQSKLYQDYGMITWPDYWERTISPSFYDIAGVKVNEKKRVRYNRFPLNVPLTEDPNLNDDEAKSVPYHDLDGAVPNLSTESGQLVVNKATHGKTLLLSLYYNIYGPNLFYKFFSLGEMGEGDKDTFPAAAIVAKQKYYHVKSYIQTFGYINSGGNFQGVSMGQKNPLKDFELFQQKVVTPGYNNDNKPMNDQIEGLKKILSEVFHNKNDVPLFAVHCNYPKLDPKEFMDREDLYDAENDRLKYKLFNGLTYQKAPTAIDGQGEVNFELEQWSAIHKTVCDDKIEFVHFKDVDHSKMCKFIKNQVKWLSLKDK